MKLDASPNPYVVIPVTFLPGDESPWLLTLKSSSSIEAKLISSENEWQTIEVRRPYLNWGKLIIRGNGLLKQQEDVLIFHHSPRITCTYAKSRSQRMLHSISRM